MRSQGILNLKFSFIIVDRSNPHVTSITAKRDASYRLGQAALPRSVPGFSVTLWIGRANGPAPAAPLISPHRPVGALL